MENSALSVPELRRLYLKATELQVERITDSLTPSGRYIVQLARRRLGESFSSSGAPTEEELFELIGGIEDAQNELLTERERTAVVASLTQSFQHFDVLTPLIDDSSVNDIIVRSYNDISVQKNRENYFTGLSFSDDQGYRAFVEQLLKRAGKACTIATPLVDCALGSNIRICVTHESISPSGSGPFLTLRLARHATVSLAALNHSGLGPPSALNYLGTIASAGGCTILIAGEVGTGKTTLLRALAKAVPDNEALLIIEDTEEIRLQRRFTRTLLTREANTEGSGRVTPAQAIRAGMRMAMNRIILGEMRDGDAAEAFIDVCASGHAGMSTIHAKSARDALSRLELFLHRAQGEIGVATIRKQIANAVSVIVHLAVDKREGKRRIFEIVEVGSSADGAIQLSPIFAFRPAESAPLWERLNGISNYSATLREHRCALPGHGTRVGLEDTQEEVRCFG